MPRNVLVLWRYSEALDSEGMSHDFRSVGGQMRGVKKGDRLFFCATSGDELYLLGLGEVKKVSRERNARLQAKFGGYSAVCKNLSRPFKILPLRTLKWRLRFESTAADRLHQKVRLALQVQRHRILTQASADLLAKKLGEDVATLE